MQKYTIHMIGFSKFEESTLESFFRIASQRLPGCSVTNQIGEASIILLSASSRQNIDDWSSHISPRQKVIIVGESDYGTGWAVLPRPMRLTSVLAKLKEIETHPGVEDWAETTHDVLPELMEPPAPTRQQVSPMVSMDMARGFAGPDKVSIVASPTADTSMPLAGRILVVDDSDVALKFMQNRLRHFGYESQVVRSGEEALAMVASHSFQFVFLDVMMAGLDGYQTCKAIKQNKARRGPPPVVVMLTSRGGTIDKIRGTMAGCDAYLTKPLNEKQLVTVLQKHDPSGRAAINMSPATLRPSSERYKAGSR